MSKLTLSVACNKKKLHQYLTDLMALVRQTGSVVQIEKEITL